MTLTLAQKAALRDHRSPEALIAFLTIEHPGLPEPLRLVRNTVDMVRGGALHRAVMFDRRLVTDTDGAPIMELQLPNVDARIGAAVRRLNDTGRVRLDLCVSSDFNETVDPHTEIGTAAPIYALAEFKIKRVTVTASEVTAQVGLPDFSTEPWPSLRATQNRFPGLFA